MVKPLLPSLASALAMVMALASQAAALADPSRDDLNRSLREAARVGDLPRIEASLQAGADINAAAPHGETALYYAALFGRTHAAIRLIERGADLEATTYDLGRTVLLRAAESCDSRLVEALLKAGADINRVDAMGAAPLMEAVESSCVRTVAILLSFGRGKIHLHARDHSFRSAEDYARHPWIEGMLKLARGQKVEPEALPPTPQRLR
jgi:ankyrin repeat protein